MKALLSLVMTFILTACSSTLPKVDHGKRYMRYFSPTEEVAYSLYPPVGSWGYLASKYKGENTGSLAFLTQVNPYVSIEVTFMLQEFRLEFNDAASMESNIYFFKNRKLNEVAGPDRVRTISVGSQGYQCVKNMGSSHRHYGPSRDPAQSGKWAGGGNSRYSYQTHCPFHMNEQHFRLWMDKTIIVADAAEAAGFSVDISAINDEIDRRFEPVWQSIWFNPKLSQAPFPEPDLVGTTK